MNREVILHRITTLLSRFQEEVRIDNANGEFSINIHAESVLLDILNIAYDLDLVNINYKEGKTFPAIDLEDEEKKTAFQISSSGTVDKVVHTLQEFAKYGLNKKFDQLYFYFLKGMDENVRVDNKRIARILGGLENVNLVFLDHAQFYSYLNEMNDMYRLIKIRNLLETQFNDSILSEIPFKDRRTLTDIPAFTKLFGRNEDISHILEKFENTDTVCIYADGGVGKTAVAMAIMETVRKKNIFDQSHFEYFAWITSSGSLKKDLTILNVPTVKGLNTDDEILKVVKSFLQIHPIFLVIDNIDTLLGGEDMKLLNTIKGKTKVLITSRIKQNGIEGYALDKLDPNSAVGLFYDRYLVKDSCFEEVYTDRKDIEYVRNITESAFYNALFIELIGNMARWEFQNKLGDLCKALKKDIFCATSEVEIENQHSFSHGLSKNDLKLQNQILRLYTLSGLSKERQEIMNFMAQFPAKMSIFYELLRWAGFSIGDLKWLTERAWIEQTEDGYLLHSMVRGSVRKQGIKFDIWKYGNLISKLGYTDEYMPVTDGYIQVRKRLDNIIVLGNGITDAIGNKLQDIQSNYDLLTAVGRFLNNLAGVCLVQGKYEETLNYYLKALEIREKVLGTDHTDTATTYNDLAYFYREFGNYREAMKNCKRALCIRERVFGKENLDTAAIYNNLAVLYSVQGENKEALYYFHKDLEIRTKVLGINHPDIAMTYNNLAGVYSDLEDDKKALYYYHKALEIRKSKLGVNHPDTAATYANLAGVYKHQGKNKAALNYYMKALEITEKTLGPIHLDTATIYNNLAGVYQNEDNRRDSLLCYRKAIEITEEVLGTENPYIATMYNNYSTLLYDNGNIIESLDYVRRALSIYENTFGKDHLYTRRSRKILAEIEKAVRH